MRAFPRIPWRRRTGNPYAGRAGFYDKGRPEYPTALLDILRQDNFLTGEMVLADIGCGTGKLSRLFLENGYQVKGIEPDAEMRGAAQRLFYEYPDSELIDARAESTSLPPKSIDLVCAGTSIHWFDPDSSEKEFRRILRKPGRLLVIADSFDENCELTQFRKATEPFKTDELVVQLLRSFKGYDHYFASRIDKILRVETPMSLEEVMAYILSLTARPLPGQDGHAEMCRVIRELFEKLQVDGKVKIRLKYKLVYGAMFE